MFAKLVTVLVVLLATTEAFSLVPRSSRPSFSYSPKHPWKPMPSSPHRTKVCTVPSYGKGKDDSKNILAALKKCNNGGHVVFKKGTSYTIGTALDLQFLKHIDLGKSGSMAGISEMLTHAVQTSKVPSSSQMTPITGWRTRSSLPTRISLRSSCLVAKTSTSMAEVPLMVKDRRGGTSSPLTRLFFDLFWWQSMV